MGKVEFLGREIVFMAYHLLKSNNIVQFQKNGVSFTGYGNIDENIALVVENVERGHFEEFVHDKSKFIYLFLEGEGTFVLNDEEVSVKAGDMLVIEPGTRIYYFGCLKQVLITTPAYDEKYERHIRDIDSSENPYREKV